MLCLCCKYALKLFLDITIEELVKFILRKTKILRGCGKILLHFLTSQGAAASPERVTPRGGQPSGVEVPTKLMMEPSDDDEDTGKKKKCIYQKNN